MAILHSLIALKEHASLQQSLFIEPYSPCQSALRELSPVNRTTAFEEVVQYTGFVFVRNIIYGFCIRT